MTVEIYHGDCLEIMPTLADKSINMVLCDLPYGTTACKWDTIIPLEPLWKQYKRLIKDNGAIVLTASQPFTSALVMSNPAMFRYEWIWLKDMPSNYLLASKQPLKYHENVLLFYNQQPTYNPQMEKREDKNKRLNAPRLNKSETLGVELHCENSRGNEDYIYPHSYQRFNKGRIKGWHPTQKPVALFEYLIRTYTNEGDTVLDNCAGSFTTAIACLNTKRKYICSEKDETYFNVGQKRIEDWHNQGKLF